jgi:hypothetical protein
MYKRKPWKKQAGIMYKRKPLQISHKFTNTLSALNFIKQVHPNSVNVQ